MPHDLPAEETAHVIGCDIVAFSKKSLAEQIETVQEFRTILLAGIENLEAKPLVLDTGDGAILVFGGSIAPALALLQRLWADAQERKLAIRLGLHTGPVSRLADVNGRENVYGPGVNFAQRVMDAACDGGALFSSTAAEFARTQTGWSERLADPVTVKVKHGVHLTVCGIKGWPGASERVLASWTQHGSRNNLLAAEQAFVGRQHESERLHSLLVDDRRRLVTVAGPGGIGKTTLAKAVARDVIADFADGVWLVECDSLRTGEDVEARLSDVLGEQYGKLIELQCLIVLDCLERTANIVPFIDNWLSTCPGIQILATSRALLTSRWETEMFVGPLSVERHGRTLAEAEELFAVAARSVDSAFRITRGNRALVESIVKSVQGVPLALVLAAGRLKYASLNELDQQLAESRLRVLRRRSTAADKHADLSLVVSESLDQLAPDVRQTMLSLSVFTGGFYLADAQQVLSNPNTGEMVEILRDNSLVVGSVTGQKMRFRMLDVIAEYVDGLVDSQEIQILTKRHCHHYCEVAKAARASFDAGGWNHESEQFWSDLGNFRRAIAYASSQSLESTIQAFARALARIFMEAGLRSDFESLALTAESSKGCDDALRLELLGLLGGIYRRDDNRELAEKYWLLRAESLRTIGTVSEQADAWADLACMALQYGDIHVAKKYLAEFETCVATGAQGPQVAVGNIAKGDCLAKEGDLPNAFMFAEVASEMLADEPMGTRTLFAYAYLAELWLQVGESARAATVCRSTIPLAMAGKHVSYAGRMLLCLCKSLCALEDTSGAAQALAAACRIPKSVSQLLRAKCREARLEFASQNLVEELRKAEVDDRSWQEQARALVSNVKG